MSEDEYKKILSRKLNYYMSLRGKNQMDLMNDLHISSSTVSSWCTGQKMPRMNKLEMLADYLGVTVTDLITDTKEEKQNGLYYLNPQTAKMAQDIFENDDLHGLMDAARDLKPENLQFFTDMIKKFKEGNPDG